MLGSMYMCIISLLVRSVNKYSPPKTLYTKALGTQE